MNKWYHEKDGSVSSLRLMAVPAAWVGIGIAVAGSVAVFFGVSDSIALAGVGTGLFTVASGVKAWQKGKE